MNQTQFQFDPVFFSLLTDGTTIKAVSENIVANPGDDATLSCTVEGKPLSEEHVRWERLGYDMSEKTKVNFVNGTSYLQIKNARREDVGNFRCIADNRVANPTSRDVLLIVKCKHSLNLSNFRLRIEIAGLTVFCLRSIRLFRFQIYIFSTYLIPIIQM